MTRTPMAPCKALIALLLLCMAAGTSRAEAQSPGASITVSAQVLAVEPSAEALAAGLRLVGAWAVMEVPPSSRPLLATVSWRVPTPLEAGRRSKPGPVLTIEFLRN